MDKHHPRRMSQTVVQSHACHHCHTCIQTGCRKAFSLAVQRQAKSHFCLCCALVSGTWLGVAGSAGLRTPPKAAVTPSAATGNSEFALSTVMPDTCRSWAVAAVHCCARSADSEEAELMQNAVTRTFTRLIVCSYRCACYGCSGLSGSHVCYGT